MKIKRIIAAAAAVLMITPISVSANPDLFYICAYYGEDGNLVDAGDLGSQIVPLEHRSGARRGSS